MDAAQLLNFLRQTRQDLGCNELALRCNYQNLETVYVIERSEELAVTDLGETFQYLDRAGDEAYRRVDLERARTICLRHGATLDDHDAEHYPQVIHVVRDRPLRLAIDGVSAAVDELFSAAATR